MPTQAVAPGWWASRSVTVPLRPKDDYAVLNQGQLKNFLRATVDEMVLKLPGGAGPDLDAVLVGWRAQAQAGTADNYAAANIGQLKAVGNKVYRRLQEVGMPLLPPWSSGTSDDDDHAVANVGQAKTTFKFVVPNLLAYGGSEDPDQDGYSSAVETAMGTNPNLATSAPDTPPGLTAPLILPRLVMYYRGLSASAQMTGFQDYTGTTPLRYTTQQIELTSSRSTSGGGESSGYLSSVQNSYETSWASVESYQRPVVTPSTIPSGDNRVTTDNTYTYTSHEKSSIRRTNNPENNGLSDVKMEVSGDAESTTTIVTTSYKQLGTATTLEGPFRSSNTVPGATSGSFLYIDGGKNSPDEYQQSPTTRLWRFEDSKTTNFNYPVTQTADGTMTATLSGVITTGQLVGALSAEIGAHPAVSPAAFTPASSLSSYFNLDITRATAEDIEYRFAMEWPAGTPEARKDKNARAFLIKEGYTSNDGTIQRERYRSVRVTASQTSDILRLSALGTESGRSGRAYIAQAQVYVPLDVKCPELYLFSGHAKDVVTLCNVSGTSCEWRLKYTSPVIGTFDHPTDSACSFRATAPGKNSIQLIIGGHITWEKPVEVLDIVSRTGWGAAPAKATLTDVMPDLQHLTLHHTSNTATGPAEMRRIQQLHMTLFPYNDIWPKGRGWDDIGYHYIMGKDGVVYEGRQLEASPGTPGGPYTKGTHVKSNNTLAGIGFCTMGDYESTEGDEVWPPARQKSLEKAVSALCRRHGLSADKISHHKVLAVPTGSNACPGSNFIPSIPAISENIRINLE